MELESLLKLSKDLKNSAKTLSRNEARFLVDFYYQIQDYRIRASNQIREDEPQELIGWLFENLKTIERNIKSSLGQYSQSNEIGKWAESITGIGPVLSAGLIAHIDIEKAPTVGHIWSFAGIYGDGQVWNKGEKRPWNADLKVLCWKIGESFVKVSNHEKDIYGKVYKRRKELETNKNLSGVYKEKAIEAQKKLKRKDSITFKANKEGRLSDAHIHARAKRYAVKLFLSHWHHVMHEIHFKRPPVKPYIIEHGGHVHFIKPPNWN
jgi:hypothetical protein